MEDSQLSSMSSRRSRWLDEGGSVSPGFRKGAAVPDDGFIVHLHDAVGVAAARAARQKGKGRGWLAAR